MESRFDGLSSIPDDDSSDEARPEQVPIAALESTPVRVPPPPPPPVISPVMDTPAERRPWRRHAAVPSPALSDPSPPSPQQHPDQRQPWVAAAAVRSALLTSSSVLAPQPARGCSEAPRASGCFVGASSSSSSRPVEATSSSRFVPAPAPEAASPAQHRRSGRRLMSPLERPDEQHVSPLISRSAPTAELVSSQIELAVEAVEDGQVPMVKLDRVVRGVVSGDAAPATARRAKDLKSPQLRREKTYLY